MKKQANDDSDSYIHFINQPERYPLEIQSENCLEFGKLYADDDKLMRKINHNSMLDVEQRKPTINKLNGNFQVYVESFPNLG